MTKELFKEKLGKLRYFNIVWKDPYNGELCIRGEFDVKTCRFNKDNLLVSNYFDSIYSYDDIIGVYSKATNFD